MTVQFNLLPDVKIAYIKATRTRRVVMFIASVVTGLSVLIFIALLSFVNVVQGRHISNLTRDIESGSNKIQGIKDLDKILTVQNQLSSLPSLHDQKPLASRLSGYVEKLIPITATVSKAEINFEQTTLSLDGDADSLTTVNTLADALKFATFTAKDVKTQETSAEARAFSEVVLASFTRADNEDGSPPASYRITLKFDPLLFDNSYDVTLIVPATITTRSVTEKPGAVFQQGGQ